ncbi:hypothetical protein HC928_04925 [bacterium]|nr:hypothetical protein [bacterium]
MACRPRFDTATDAQYLAVDWSPTGEFIAAGSTEGLQIFNLHLDQIYQTEDTWVADVAWHPEKPMLVIVTDNRSLTFIRADNDSFVQAQTISIPGLEFIAWNTDGTKLGVSIMLFLGHYSLRIYEVGIDNSNQQISLVEIQSIDAFRNENKIRSAFEG